MRWNWTRALPLLAAAVGLLGGLEPTAGSELYINEVFLDPPGSSDYLSEYIELRGTPGMSLDDHYLIFVENEDNVSHTGNAGIIDRVFDLSGFSVGTNGFLVMRRQPDNPYSVAPGTTDIILTEHSQLFGNILENSGSTAMLIHNISGPAPLDPDLPGGTVVDLDVGNDGLDDPNGRAGWNILDSIGIHSEEGEADFGRLYGKVNFGPEPTTNIEPGATYVGLGFEIEYYARWGNSTGSDPADWHISNLTDNPLSGYTGMGDYRQSGAPHGIGIPGQILESSQNVPYGTNLTNTLGAANYPVPEPGSVFLFATGALGFVAFGLRRAGTPSVRRESLRSDS